MNRCLKFFLFIFTIIVSIQSLQAQTIFELKDKELRARATMITKQHMKELGLDVGHVSASSEVKPLRLYFREFQDSYFKTDGLSQHFMIYSALKEPPVKINTIGDLSQIALRLDFFRFIGEKTNDLMSRHENSFSKNILMENINVFQQFNRLATITLENINLVIPKNESLLKLRVALAQATFPLSNLSELKNFLNRPDIDKRSFIENVRIPILRIQSMGIESLKLLKEMMSDNAIIKSTSQKKLRSFFCRKLF